jgi:Tfp pilus assembly protein PilF
MRKPTLALLLALLGACAGAPTAKQREGAEIHTNLGLEALRAARTQDALREFELALKNDPGLAEAWLGRGLVMDGFGRVEDAEKDYRKAIALKADFSEAHNNLGQLLARRGRHAEALEQFDLALANMYYREPFVARCNKGQALWAMGRREEGLEQLRACTGQAPRYCAGHRALGLAQLEAGRTKEALQSLQRYGQLCDKEPDAPYQLGLAYLRTGDAAGAREAFTRCEELAGSSELGTECRRSRDLLK